MDKVWYLRRADLFRGLSDAELHQLAGLMRDRACRVGDDVVIDPSGDRVYLLKRGRVRVLVRGVAVAVLGPGQLFGTSSLFGAARTDQRVIALDDVVVCDAPVVGFLAAITRRPRLAARVVGLMARQLFELEEAAASAAAARIDGRLAELLLRIAERRDGEQVVPDVAQADLARMIGASRESVWRVVRRWQREGLVAVSGGRLRILDSERLAGVAHGREPS